MQPNKPHVNIPIFIPHKGCPHDCVFCNQRRITGQTAQPTGDDVVKVIEEYLSAIRPGTEIEAAFFGGSFTGVPVPYQEELLKAAYGFLKKGLLSGIRLSTRPDYIDEGTLKRLSRYGVTCIELGAQSMDDEVLRFAERGHSREDVVKASHLIQKAGFSLGLQMMTGLPGDTPEKACETARQFIALSPACVRIYPTVVLPGTALHTQYQQGTYRPQSLEDAADLCGELLDLFEKAGISVIRVGLHPSESLTESYAAGPFHPAFGELAKSAALFHRLRRFCENTPNGLLAIHTPRRLLSVLYGQKRSNWQRICAFLGYAPVVVLDDGLKDALFVRTDSLEEKVVLSRDRRLKT